MTDETMTAACTINVPADTVFAVLADPTTHQAIDGTGWVRESLDGKPLTEVGQIFRMAMYHDNYGGMHYEMANRVELFEPPRAIAWLPGQGADDANIEFGGWVWRYDLEALGDDRTKVTLTYDWSAVPPALREAIEFPLFDRQHLDNSLKHLSGLAQDRA
jgi:uncharacterized protein YndB with AHSA1/START domain